MAQHPWLTQPRDALAHLYPTAPRNAGLLNRRPALGAGLRILLAVVALAAPLHLLGCEGEYSDTGAPSGEQGATGSEQGAPASETIDPSIVDETADPNAPGAAELYYSSGIAYYDKGDLDRALADFDRVIALQSGDVDAYYSRGLTYYGKGDLGRAIADYSKAIELQPNDADTHYNRGVAYYDQGDLERAIADYDKAIELQPNDAEAYYNRGITYAAQGLADRALADFQKVLDLSDDAELEQIAREAMTSVSGQE